MSLIDVAYCQQRVLNRLNLTLVIIYFSALDDDAEAAIQVSENDHNSERNAVSLASWFEGD